MSTHQPTRSTVKKEGKARKGKVEGPTPFKGCLDYLDAWFALLGPAREEVETPATLGRIPDFDERKWYLAFLMERTELSIAAGISLPYEDYVRANELDLLDRVILLALLRAAHDPVGEGGLRVIRLFWALGANSLGRQHEVLSRVETSGRLRDLGAVQCFVSFRQACVKWPDAGPTLMAEGRPVHERRGLAGDGQGATACGVLAQGARGPRSTDSGGTLG